MTYTEKERENFASVTQLPFFCLVFTTNFRDKTRKKALNFNYDKRNTFRSKSRF